jgi:hypothetical protein
MLRRPKHSKNEVVAPEEEKEEDTQNCYFACYLVWALSLVF